MSTPAVRGARKPLFRGVNVVAALLVLAAALPAPAQQLPNASPNASQGILQITGWRMHEGDNPAWARPDFDDSQWEKVDYSRLNAPGVATGTRWYRATFQAPAGFAGQQLALGMGPLEEVYDVYVNGVRVGHYGFWQPSPHGPFPRHLVFAIPPGLLRGPVDHIAIRQWRGAAGLDWLTFALSGNLSFDHPPEIGLRTSIEALEKLHPAAGAIQAFPWDLTEILFLFAAAISFVLFSAQWRRAEYLYLGVFSVLQSTPLLGSAIATSESVMARSWAPVLIFALSMVSDAFALLFLAALCPRVRRLLYVGAVFLGLLAVVSGYSLAAQSYGAALFWSCGSSIGVAAFELIAIFALLLDRKLGSMVIAFFLMLDAAGWALWAIAANFDRRLRLSFFAGQFRIDLPSVTGILFVFATLLVLYLRYRDEQARQIALDQDLAAARRMQEHLLTAGATCAAGFTIDAVYRPAREVGGDFYRAVPLGDGFLLVILGDVSGKGLDAAMLVAVILGSLANEVERSPASLLAYLNRAVLGRTAGGFITACCARFYPDGRVVLANAGQIPPYQDGHELQLENGLPLGISAQATYGETEFRAAGPITFLSDGVVEARNASGELLGFDRMAPLTATSAAEIADAAQRWGQEDDITVLAVSRAPRLEAVPA